MLSRGDLTSLPPVSTVQALAPLDRTADPRQDGMRQLLQIAIGQQVPATILSALEDGTYLVKLSDTTARMALPAGSKAGDTLQLTMAATSPRPTFLLTLDNDSAPSSLSSAARLIDRILHVSTAPGSMAVQGEAPLLDLSPAGALPGKEPAATVHYALARSGLFYESHLAQWVNGSLNLADLQSEPQARHGAHFQNDPASGTHANDVRNSHLATLVGAQLHALENQQIAWHGEAWSGQPVQWEVEREPDGMPQHEEVTPTWKSSLRLELPHLGTVTASITLVGEHLQLHLGTDAPGTTSTLREHADALGSALAAAGARLDHLQVKEHG